MIIDVISYIMIILLKYKNLNGEASFADINDMKKFFLTYTDDYDVNNFTVDTYKPWWAV